MIKRIASSVCRFHWIYIIVFTGLTVFFGIQLKNAEIDPSVKSQLPADLPSRVNLDRIEEIFGGTDMVMIILSADDVLDKGTLERLEKVSNEMEMVTDFDRVVSIFTLKDIRGENGEMIVDPAVREIPESAKEREQLRKTLRNNDMVYGSVLSENFRHTAVLGFLNFKAVDEVVFKKLDKIIKNNPGPGELYAGGMPVTRVFISRDIRGDMSKFMPIGLLVMLIFLFVCFRQLRGVALPFLVTVMAIIVAMGLIPLLGWKIHMVTVILPVILLAVANDYGIHLMARYQEDNAPGTNLSSADLAKSGIMELTRPVLATGITTIAGLLCLLSHIIIPAEQMAVLASAGVAVAILGSLLFIPAVLAILPKARPVLTGTLKTDKTALLERFLSSLASGVARRPKATLVSCIAFAVVIGTGSAFIVVDTNPNNFYEKDEPVRVATELLNEHLGGWAGVSVIAEGDVKHPDVMKQIDRMEKHLESHPKVGTTTSIATVVRNMNEVMHDSDTQFDRIPDSREAIAQYFLLYSMSGDPDDFDKLVDFPYRHAQVMARVGDSSTNSAVEIIDHIKKYMAGNPDSPFIIVGGFLDILTDMVSKMVEGQITSLVLSMILVALLVGILMRSFMAGLLAALPLALSMLILFGLMGYVGIELNVVTTLLSSIMIGVGVDYTIHFLWRYREERRKGLEPVGAVKKTLTSTGRGIIFNALSVVVGFAVLMISAFFPVRFFGMLVVVCILTCLIGALVVLPAIAIVFRPRFLEPEKEISSPDPASNIRKGEA